MISHGNMVVKITKNSEAVKLTKLFKGGSTFSFMTPYEQEITPEKISN